MNQIASVLVTGGSGTFGQAFIRHLLKTTAIPRICIYSRSEHTQADFRQALSGNERLRWFIGDVRDVDRLSRACRGCDTVVHAAALKRIEVGRHNPEEMVKTNILGALNLIEATLATGVERVVALSTDKAYQPVSPYGQSKALAESLFLAANELTGARFAVTRYGNVSGSNGSVIAKWKALKAQGFIDLPVTDLECTRFHMSVQDAIDLVWATVLTMQGGELVIPDDLPAYRLGDLVAAFDAAPIITGLPAWEKLHESMRDGYCSKDARRLTIPELKQIIAEI